MSWALLARGVRLLSRAVDVAEKFADSFTPLVRRRSRGLSHKEVRHQQTQIAAATSHKAPGCCPFARSGGFHGEDCYDLGREDCTALKRGRRPTGKPHPDES